MCPGDVPPDWDHALVSCAANSILSNCGAFAPGSVAVPRLSTTKPASPRLAREQNPSQFAQGATAKDTSRKRVSCEPIFSNISQIFVSRGLCASNYREITNPPMLNDHRVRYSLRQTVSYINCCNALVEKIMHNSSHLRLDGFPEIWR